MTISGADLAKISEARSRNMIKGKLANLRRAVALPQDDEENANVGISHREGTIPRRVRAQQVAPAQPPAAPQCRHRAESAPGVLGVKIDRSRP